MTEIDANRLYTLTEIEPVLGINHQTLKRYCREDKLKGVLKIGGKWRISGENLLKLINGN